MSPPAAGQDSLYRLPGWRVPAELQAPLRLIQGHAAGLVGRSPKRRAPSSSAWRAKTRRWHSHLALMYAAPGASSHPACRA